MEECTYANAQLSKGNELSTVSSFKFAGSNYHSARNLCCLFTVATTCAMCMYRFAL